MTAPQTAALVGQPRSNSPSTSGPVAADVVHLQAATEGDLANEVVITGAHFDTYPYATGATDNTTGSSATDDSRRAVGGRGARTARLA